MRTRRFDSLSRDIRRVPSIPAHVQLEMPAPLSVDAESVRACLWVEQEVVEFGAVMTHSPYGLEPALQASDRWTNQVIFCRFGAYKALDVAVKNLLIYFAALWFAQFGIVYLYR